MVARFDLDKVRRELTIAVMIPTVLFVVSLTSLIIITRSVRVGDDAKMRCKYCIDDQETENESKGLFLPNQSTSSSRPANDMAL